MGASSNFIPVRDWALTGSRSENDGEAKRLRAAARERPIRRGFMAIERRHQMVLESAFELRRWPQFVKRRFGTLAGLAVATPLARKGFEADRGTCRARPTVRDWLDGRIEEGDTEAVLGIAREVDALWRNALRAYLAARADDAEKSPAAAFGSERSKSWTGSSRFFDGSSRSWTDSNRFFEGSSRSWTGSNRFLEESRRRLGASNRFFDGSSDSRGSITQETPLAASQPQSSVGEKGVQS